MNATAEAPTNLNIVLDVPVSLTIELGGCQLPMREVLQLTMGSVVQLDKAADAPVELSINGKLIARGEVVVIEERFRRENHGSYRPRAPGDLKPKNEIDFNQNRLFGFCQFVFCLPRLPKPAISTPRL